MAGLHTEIQYEDEFVRQLVPNYGLLEGTDAGYGKAFALYTEDVIVWIDDARSKGCAKVKVYNNGATDRPLLERLGRTIQFEGTHAVVHNGFMRRPVSLEMCASAKPKPIKASV
jgi:hypothetical protein